MYKTKKATKTQLQSIVIKDQKEILRLTKNELSPTVIWEVIKQESQNFTISNEKALKADELLDYLLKNNTGTISNEARNEVKNTEEPQINKSRKMSLSKFYELKKKRRARELMLLELETESFTAA